MGSVTTFVFVMVLVILVSRAITAQIKEKKEAELLERNPEAWKALKEEEAKTKERNQRVAKGLLVKGVKIAERAMKQK
jgi:hypothetical protein